ncbi:histidine phosphatase family protein [Bordetella genomosp. 9]|uniref:Histidine phosphatase family protein n=1 Tax=Bordetella genomosp. 9 TaxID=1416803 RepID=A0A261RDG9_9BORD|nr:histidine phosphatase family protein [Bordetella genomosp. 9]OZI23054.1 histidine phosphatase family protein [Bordetella genomosp. 9]
MTEIWLIRHGETDWNRARRLQGWQDTPLNAHGANQARRLAERLDEDARNGGFDALYSSDLQRTLHTAEPAAARLDLPVRPEPGLRERCYGVLEGVTMDRLDIEQPEAAAAWKSREPDRPLDGGESLRQFHNRIVATIDDIAERHDGGRVLVFTHGGVLDIVWRHAHGIPLTHPRDAALLNAGVNRLAVENRKWHVMGWGDVTHIATLSADDIV